MSSGVSFIEQARVFPQEMCPTLSFYIFFFHNTSSKFYVFKLNLSWKTSTKKHNPEFSFPPFCSNETKWTAEMYLPLSGGRGLIFAKQLSTLNKMFVVLLSSALPATQMPPLWSFKGLPQTLPRQPDPQASRDEGDEISQSKLCWDYASCLVLDFFLSPSLIFSLRVLIFAWQCQQCCLYFVLSTKQGAIVKQNAFFQSEKWGTQWNLAPLTLNSHFQ